MSNRHQRHTVLTGVAAGLASSLLLAGCASEDSPGADDSGQAASETSLSIGTGAWLGYGGWDIAAAQGYFEDENLDVELSPMGASDRFAAFASGQVPVANFGVQNAFMLAEQGVDFRIIGLQDYSLEADAILLAPGVTLDGLEGARVAYEPVSTSEIMTSAALETVGLTTDDVEAVPMGASDAAAAIIAGQVEAAVTYEPYLSPALEEVEGMTLGFTAGDEPGLVSDIIIVDPAWADANPDAVQGLIDAWGAAMDYYNSDTDDARAIIAEANGADPDSLDSAFDGLLFYTNAEALDLLTGEYLDEVMPRMVSRSHDAGMIESDDFDLAAMIDTSYLESSE